MNKQVAGKFYYLFIITYYFFTSCKKDAQTTQYTYAQNYVSNNVGRWIIYDCDSIVHLDNDFGTDQNVDTFLYQVKEQIDSMGIDGENQAIQHLSRFTRLNDTLPWTFYERWTAKLTATNYQKVEENIRYLKLTFPISNSQKWNGNAYNALGEEDYFYGDFNVSATFGSFSFDSSLTVVQGDSTIGFQQYPFGIEKYATGLGMYYHYYAVVDYKAGTDSIITGVQYHERINSYGHY